MLIVARRRDGDMGNLGSGIPSAHLQFDNSDAPARLEWQMGFDYCGIWTTVRVAESRIEHRTGISPINRYAVMIDRCCCREDPR